jgi:hypothetical protein
MTFPGSWPDTRGRRCAQERWGGEWEGMGPKHTPLSVAGSGKVSWRSRSEFRVGGDVSVVSFPTVVGAPHPSGPAFRGGNLLAHLSMWEADVGSLAQSAKVCNGGCQPSILLPFLRPNMCSATQTSFYFFRKAPAITPRKPINVSFPLSPSTCVC